MAEEGKGDTLRPTQELSTSAEPPIRVDLFQELTDPGENATAQQRESYELQQRVREIVKEAGVEPNRGTPYVEAALAQMGYELRAKLNVDEKIAIKLAHPDYDLGQSLTPDNDYAMYLQKLQPLHPTNS
jgi:hypothetical protein